MQCPLTKVTLILLSANLQDDYNSIFVFLDDRAIKFTSTGTHPSWTGGLSCKYLIFRGDRLMELNVFRSSVYCDHLIWHRVVRMNIISLIQPANLEKNFHHFMIIIPNIFR